MLKSVSPLPIEIYELIADRLTSFDEFVKFKTAFGISNSLAFSGKTSADIQKDFLHILNCAKNLNLMEKTLLRMFKRSKLFEAKRKPAILCKLAELNLVDAMEQYLLNASLKPNIKCFEACKTVDACLLLLRNGFSPNLQDKAGNTYLHQCSDIEIARVFLNAGANPNAANISQQTPLHSCMSAAMAELLLDSGAIVDATDKEGKTPLMEHANDIDIIHVLLKYRSNIELADLTGKTVLHITQEPAVMELICSKNCNVNSRDFLGRTALSCHGRRKDLKKILVKYGGRLSNLELLGFPFDMIYSVGGKPFRFKTILQHKILGDPRFHQRVEYLVDWSDHTPTWEPSNMFKTMQMIYLYWSSTDVTIPKPYEKAVGAFLENRPKLQTDDYLAFRMETLNVQLG